MAWIEKSGLSAPVLSARGAESYRMRKECERILAGQTGPIASKRLNSQDKSAISANRVAALTAAMAWR